MVVGAGEADRWLEPVLQQLHWADEVCIVMNNADRKTEDLCYKYGTILHHDNREWGKEQFRIKQDFLNTIVPLLTVPGRPNNLWIWCLDADEIFDQRFDRAMAEKMAAGDDIAWYFWCLQLWNTDDQVRLDLSFANIRFYKVAPELGLHFLAQPLHCGLAPMYAYRHGSQSGLFFKHYGLMAAADRARKVARYDKYDPRAAFKGKVWYDGLRNERAASVPIAEAIKKLPNFIYRNKPVKPTHMAKDREIFFFTNQHGRTVEAVGEKQRGEFIKRGMREVKDLKINTNPEAEVVRSESADKPAEPEDNAGENLGESPKGESTASDAPKRKGSGKARGSKKSA